MESHSISLVSAHSLWDTYTLEVPKSNHCILKAGNPRDLSLFAEYLAGAYFLSLGLALRKVEFFGDRIRSPRRRDRAKTCDFEVIERASDTNIFIEVKHVVGTSNTTLASFLRNAHLKGARWLTVVRFEGIVDDASQIRVREKGPADWSVWISAKQVLKFRRNGLVRMLELVVS